MTFNLKRTGSAVAVAAALAAAFASAPASAVTLVGLTSTAQLVTFDSSTPTAVLPSAVISGLLAGENIVSIDYRNPDNTIYGLGSLGNLYSLNATTGVATATGATGLIPATAAGVTYEVDWNPNNNNLRIIGNSAAPNSNRAFTFSTGVTAVQTALTRADAGGPLNIVGAAYNNNALGAAAATLSLFYIDANSDALFSNTNAFGGGVLTKVADLSLGGASFGINSQTGFDIASTGEAFVAIGENLYSLNLGTGALANQGSIGPNFTVIGLTSLAPVPETQTYALMLAGLAAIGFVARRRTLR